MRQKLNVILTLLLAFAVQMTFAQEKTVTGTVTSDDGLPLAGVNVIIQGTTQGTLTDFSGNYSIEVSPGQVLVFSYVGYTNAEKTVGTQDVLDVVLQVDAAQLEQVIVVGYGTTTKQSFTGSATVVSGEELSQKNVAGAAQALAGEVAGVRIINTTGQPGSEPSVRIRGFGSVTGGGLGPLYVVDGVPYSGNVAAINPADIESTVVLKDATATAVYGARGANGVILINTKDGVAGESYIKITTKTGQNIRLLPTYSTIESPDKFIALAYESLYNQGIINGVADPTAYAQATLFDSDRGIDPKYNFYNTNDVSQIIDPATGMVRPGVGRRYTPIDWEEYAFQPSRRTEANVRIAGGNEKSTYYASFGYLNSEGYIVNSDYERFTTRLNITHEVKDWLSGTVNMGYTLSESNFNGQTTDSGSIFWFTNNIPPIYPLFVRDANGDFVEDPIYGGNQFDYGDNRGFGLGTNAIADATYGINNQVKHELNLSNTFKATITEGLTFETRFGMQYYNANENYLRSQFYGPASRPTTQGRVTKQKNQLFTYNFLQLLRYKTEFGDHSLEVFAAHESNSWEFQYMSASVSKLAIPGLVELSNGVVGARGSSYTNEYSLESYFGQVNYNFDDRYFVSGTVRRDGSSRFLEGNKWGTFGSVGLAWVLTNEAFMQDQDLLSRLKLKGSYGLTGNQSSVGLYPWANHIQIENLNDNISLSTTFIGNPDLTWETATMAQVGVEFALKRFLDVSVDYYRKNTVDLLFEKRLAISTGAAIKLVNDGELLNSGLEFNVTAHLLDEEDYYLDFNINGALLHNEIIHMPAQGGTGREKAIDVAGAFGRAVGHSIYDFYIREYAGVNAATGAGLWYSYYEDANGNGIEEASEIIESLTLFQSENPDAVISKTVTELYQEATRKYVGKTAIPDVRGGFSLASGYKGFDLSVQFIYGLGGYAIDGAYSGLMHNGVPGTNNWHTNILNRWQEPGDITNVPRLSANEDKNVASRSTRWLTSKDFLSLNNVRLGYTIPDAFVKSLGLDQFTVFVSGTNLMLLSARDGFNPMTSSSGNSSTYTYSPLSTISAGLNISF